MAIKWRSAEQSTSQRAFANSAKWDPVCSVVARIFLSERLNRFFANRLAFGRITAVERQSQIVEGPPLRACWGARAVAAACTSTCHANRRQPRPNFDRPGCDDSEFRSVASGDPAVAALVCASCDRRCPRGASITLPPISPAARSLAEEQRVRRDPVQVVLLLSRRAAAPAGSKPRNGEQKPDRDPSAAISHFE